MTEINPEWLEQLETIRTEFANGDNVEQRQLDEVCRQWNNLREVLRPGEKSEEFELVDAKGNSLDLHAPRWFCHLLGLRHRCAHILLRWTTPGLGRLFVFQIRSWSKSDSPGHVDISVGGHVVGGNSPEQTAYTEMKEELGAGREDIVGGKLVHRIGYLNKPEKRLSENFYNTEWCDVYAGDLIPSHFGNLHFNDKEVVGLYLCPELEAKNLLEEKKMPIASALQQFLEYLLSADE